MRESIRRFEAKEMFAPALFLACKVEEQHRKLRDIVTEVHKHGALLAGTAPTELPPESNEAFRTRALYHEDILLRVLSYQLTFEHPFVHIMDRAYTFLPRACKTHSRYYDDKDHAIAVESREDRLARIAYSICCDRCVRAIGCAFDARSYATVACLRFPPRTIAGACLVLAARQAGENVPAEADPDRDDWADRYFATTEAAIEGTPSDAAEPTDAPQRRPR